MKASPSTIDELLDRAEALAGLTLGELAQSENIRVPNDFKREKGWSGQLLELALGAEAGSKAQQDFANIGVELKTIPIDVNGYPLETTYVCYAHLVDVAGIHWATSSVRNKLNKVLWVPIDGRRDIPPSERTIGTPFLWSLQGQQEAYLRQDWEEIMDMIAMGDIEKVTARYGEYMQLRPKAANGSVLTDAIGKNGQIIQTRPRGFYLRKEFTHKILDDYFS
ncbi:DNA mismatch repair endonuclease MutH [Paraglaciecola mesophila]|uniref:DNA mismatch repair protein MutH n=2 Tax=Paraglaciecola mesophila TaxID=197222 RepID=K6Y140_9ALTE|nr:DNA mismatch repair endonuclease MutH [Paraglaciecola mesophila]GAC26559.1 DNA mismatch repair protein MutH [Paraglaciecola mesophila KMM 241]|tara:strand:+ start:646 stop:1311 length:666 start_codon:yes stop_codon:yes gene_type:complete